MDSLFFHLYLIFGFGCVGTTNGYEASAMLCSHVEFVVLRQALFFFSLSDILRLHGRCYGEKEEGRRRLLCI